MKKLFVLFLAVVYIAAFYGCSSDDGDGGGTGPVIVPEPRLVVAVHQDPGLASVDNDVWDSIDAVTVPLGTDTIYNAGLGAITTLNAELKALRTGSYIYLQAKWNDDSKDAFFNKLQGVDTAGNLRWRAWDTTLINNEDRFYVLFDQGGSNGADCAGMCHATANASGHSFYGSATDDADIWHWKAYRTGGAGFAEDMFVTSDSISPDPQDQTPNDNLYFRNYTTIGGSMDNAIPILMHPDSSDYTDFVIKEPDLTAYQQGTGSKWFGFEMAGYYLNGLSGADGSRWDVHVVQHHDGSNWTVVFRRALNTGDADDINLSSVDSVSISIATGDNSGIKHWGAEPFYMVFE